jgi:hypothetical protein
MSGASEVFVKGLKNKLIDEKIQDEFKRNLLQDALEYILEIFKKSDNIEVRTIRDFETKDVCLFLDLHSKIPIEDSFSECFSQHNIEHKKIHLDDYKWVFQIDLEDKIISSGNPHNLFFVEIHSKRGNSQKVKFSIFNKDFNFSIFDKAYNHCKFWVFSDKNFEKYELSLRSIDRGKRKQKLDTPDNKYTASFHLNDLGEINLIEISKKRGGKSKFNTITDKIRTNV